MIQIFITGGTFDKEYNYITGELFFKETHVPAMLDLGRCSVDIQTETLMMIDSLKMTHQDRIGIVTRCKGSEKDRIIITHGTDTMVETANFVAQEKLQKTIIFTGAMIPYAFGSSSDGFFNLGSAIAFVQTLPFGVYIVMNGRYFHYNEVVKNRQTGNFEEIKLS